MRLLPLIAILASSPALAADCPFATTVADANGLLDSAESSYGDLDVDGFDAALDELSLTLQCLDERMPTATAAKVHRLQALRSFIAGDDAQWPESLRAAKALEPAYSFPDSLLPTNHPLRTEYGRMSAKVSEGTAVPPSTQGTLAFDGVQTDVRPAHATFFQVLGADGVITNRYVWPSQPLPAYAGEDGSVPVTESPVTPPDDPIELPPPPDTKPPVLESTGIALAAVGSVGAGVFYWRALHHKSLAEQPQPRGQFAIDHAAYKKARGRTMVMGGVAAGGLLLTVVGLALPITDDARLGLAPNGLVLSVGGR